MSVIKSIILSFSMFSSIPVPQVQWNEKNMRYMMCAFPFVGLVIALLCAAWFTFGLQIMFVWKKPVFLPLFALGFTLIPPAISGGIHLDGFMDTCDALGSHGSREKKLEILKDSHSGAFAVLSCTIYFLAYFVLSMELYGLFFSAATSLRFENLFSRFACASPVLSIFFISRLLSSLAVAIFPVAKDSGLLHAFSSASAKNITIVFCLFFFMLTAVLLIFFTNFLGIAMIATSLSFFCFYFVVALRNFGGITGDTAGWFVQISEILGLAVFVIMNGAR